jgi:hypothetical protein
MSQEVWAPIPGFPNYNISNLGNVYNIRENRIMRTSKNNWGYLKITLQTMVPDENGELVKQRFTRSVALMVAEAFVESPNWLCDKVIVLDGNLENVAATNLAWRPRWYAYLYFQQSRKVQPVHYHNLAVQNVTTGYCYNNIIEAGMAEGLLYNDIWDSTYQAKKLFPYGHIFKIIERV